MARGMWSIIGWWAGPGSYLNRAQLTAQRRDACAVLIWQFAHYQRSVRLGPLRPRSARRGKGQLQHIVLFIAGILVSPSDVDTSNVNRRRSEQNEINPTN